jgi:hypothetical protein
MARFALITPIAGAPPSSGVYQKFKTGTIVVDSAVNALAPTDVVWPSVAASASPLNMVPLDAAASAQMGIPIFVPGVSPLLPHPGGVGTDAGA